MSATPISIRASEFSRGARGCRSNISAASRSSSACWRGSGRSGSRWPSCWARASPTRSGSASTASCSTAASASPASAICLFWLFTAIFAGDHRAVRSARRRSPIMKDALPGAVVPDGGGVYLFGGDKLARDVFSRMVFGSQIVLIIAPAATAFALMVGITLGLPAGYYGGRIDSVLSFLANLVLAFPVILLFYLLVTPGIMDTPIPYALAGRVLPVPDHLLRDAVLHALQEPAGPALHPARPDAGHRRLGLCRPGLRRRPARHRVDRPEPAQHLRGGGVRLQPRRVPHRARPGDGHQDARLRGGGADARRDARGTSCCGRSCPMRAAR